MFRALLCSSSGGQILSVHQLVSSLSLGDCSVHRLREDFIIIIIVIIIIITLMKICFHFPVPSSFHTCLYNVINSWEKLILT